jgi:ATP-dependent Lon protease
MDTIPAPLFDRMEIMKLSGYIMEEKLQIARKYLVSKQLKEHGLKKGMVTIDNNAIKGMVDGYAREAGVRSLENNIKKVMRKAARKFAEGSTEPINVTDKNLEEFLGKPRFTDESLYDKSIPGVVMGLAWTSMGGTTLYIESTAIHTKSKVSNRPDS